LQNRGDSGMGAARHRALSCTGNSPKGEFAEQQEGVRNVRSCPRVWRRKEATATRFQAPDPYINHNPNTADEPMKWSASAFAVVLALAFTAVLTSRSTGRSDDDHGRDRDRDSRIKIGYLINPVHLNLEGKNRALVGLGSYIVNAQAGCNDCHSCPSYAPGHNPYLGQPKQFNAENFLAGGVPFGPFTSRNLTPEENGLPAG
jgi:hypothetical protein